MGCGDNGDPVAGDVNTKCQTAFISLWEVTSNQVSGLMTDIEKDAFGAKPFHFKIDGSGHNISRRQLPAIIEIGHESLATGKMQRGPFAAKRLGHQE